LEKNTEKEVNRLLPLVKERIKKKSWFIDEKNMKK